VDSATRQILLLRRDGLIAKVRRLDAEKNARFRVVTSDPNFDPIHNRSMDSQAEQLLNHENAVLLQIEAIDRELRG